MADIDFNELARPIDKSEVKTRKGPGGTALDYITSRTVMNRLDKNVGSANWRDEYTPLVGGAVLCTLYLRVGIEWVGKSDVGVPSKIEPEKGAHSDAFKRAAVKWGIGRELYEEGTAFEDAPPPMASQTPQDARKTAPPRKQAQPPAQTEPDPVKDLAARTFPYGDEAKTQKWPDFCATDDKWTKSFWPAVKSGLGYADNTAVHEALGLNSVTDSAGTVGALWLKLAKHSPLLAGGADEHAPA